MIILHVSGLSGNKSAGPTNTVPKNVEYGSKYADVALYNLSDNQLNGLIKPDKLFLSKEYPTISSLPYPFNKPDIVVFQSMYIKGFIKVYRELKKLHIPYVITPRGSLTEKAQCKKRIKKIIGNVLFFNRFIKDADTINFLTENEYRSSNKFDFKNYYINGNGIDNCNKKRDFSKQIEEFVVSFIGRIEWYHKGLDYLIESINLGKDEFRNKRFIFNLYGPDDFNSYEKLNQLIEKYSIGDLVKILGPVFEKEKEKVLLNTDLFIHTSRLEGQPNSVIEAMNYGVPVLVTPGTNIDKMISNNNLGFVADFNVKDIKDKLLFAYKNRHFFKNIGDNEKKYTEDHFDWSKIVKKNIEEYSKFVK